MRESGKITYGAPPYHAYFENDQGDWYMVWMTQTQPKTSRGHPWHVHIRWSKTGAATPRRDWPWWERLWGQTNRDFHDPHAAVVEFFQHRYHPRVVHGYRLVEGHIAPGWPTPGHGGTETASPVKVTNKRTKVEARGAQ